MSKMLARHNVKYLGMFTYDSYQLITKFPIKTIDDITGHKIAGAGPNLSWIKAVGAVPVQSNLVEGSLVRETYGSDSIEERHRHRFEVNNNYVEQLEKAGLRIGGWSTDNNLVEVVEVPGHPWFVACQFHPEFTSTPRDGHPLFKGFVEAAIKYHGSK